MTRRPVPSGGALAALLCTIAAAQAGPRVDKLVPPHLATSVDPDATTRLVIAFDQDMDPSRHSLCGGGPSFPKVHDTTWEDARTFALDVRLAEDRVYSMDLSCVASSGFWSKAGVRLAPTPWRIATAGPRLADGAAAKAAERLFAAIADHYSYRDRLGIDWSSLQQAQQDSLAASPNGAALALAVMSLLQAAQDPHVTVQWKDAVLPTCERAVTANFDSRGLQKTLPKATRVGRIGLQARTDDGIGYLLVSTFAREQRDEFELVIEAARSMLDCKALVLDVRTNSGGDELLARRLAAFFVDGEKVYAAHRVRDPKAEGGFQARQDRRIRGNAAPDLFPGKVAVLMGPLNMSSAEAFLLMMKQSPGTVLVGANSYGSSGNPTPHELGAGLTVMLPSWQALRPDGSCIEGEGISPHIHVAATPAQLADGDPVLDEALLRLRGVR